MLVVDQTLEKKYPKDSRKHGVRRKRNHVLKQYVTRYLKHLRNGTSHGSKKKKEGPRYIE
jgi:hypothetical protein